MQIGEIQARFLEELLEAEEKFPGWPMDVIHAAAIATEEKGELLKAAIDFYYGRGTREKMLKEAVQVGAMAMRFLINLDDYRPEADRPEINFLRKKECGEGEKK